MTTTIPDEFRDLLHTPTVILATNGPSGRPQLTAIWYLWDSQHGVARTSLNNARQKMINLRADPRCTLFSVDPHNDGRTLELRCDASWEPDPDFSWATKFGTTKYGGADVHLFDAPDETRSIVTLHPKRVRTTLMWSTPPRLS